MNMSIDLCGVKLNNPVIAASGCFGVGKEMMAQYDLSTLGGISLKAVTGKKRLGNPPPRIAETPSGVLNAVGLQNPGIDAFIEKEIPIIKRINTVLFANAAGSTLDEYIAVVEKLSSVDIIDFIELNISCPNVKEGGVAFGAKPETIYDIVSRVKPYAKAAAYSQAYSQHIGYSRKRESSRASGCRWHISHKYIARYGCGCRHKTSCHRKHYRRPVRTCY